MAAADIDWTDLGAIYREGMRHSGGRWLLLMVGLLALGVGLQFLVYFGP